MATANAELIRDAELIQDAAATAVWREADSLDGQCRAAADAALHLPEAVARLLAAGLVVVDTRAAALAAAAMQAASVAEVTSAAAVVEVTSEEVAADTWVAAAMAAADTAKL
jgi:hypothetical protein